LDGLFGLSSLASIRSRSNGSLPTLSFAEPLHPTTIPNATTVEANLMVRCGHVAVAHTHVNANVRHGIAGFANDFAQTKAVSGSSRNGEIRRVTAAHRGAVNRSHWINVAIACSAESPHISG
jgi:hypothetical protein